MVTDSLAAVPPTSVIMGTLCIDKLNQSESTFLSCEKDLDGKSDHSHPPCIVNESFPSVINEQSKVTLVNQDNKSSAPEVLSESKLVSDVSQQVSNNNCADTGMANFQIGEINKTALLENCVSEKRGDADSEALISPLKNHNPTCEQHVISGSHSLQQTANFSKEISNEKFRLDDTPNDDNSNDVNKSTSGNCLAVLDSTNHSSSESLPMVVSCVSLNASCAQATNQKVAAPALNALSPKVISCDNLNTDTGQLSSRIVTSPSSRAISDANVSTICTEQLSHSNETDDEDVVCISAGPFVETVSKIPSNRATAFGNQTTNLVAKNNVKISDGNILPSASKDNNVFCVDTNSLQTSSPLRALKDMCNGNQYSCNTIRQVANGNVPFTVTAARENLESVLSNISLQYIASQQTSNNFHQKEISTLNHSERERLLNLQTPIIFFVQNQAVNNSRDQPFEKQSALDASENKSARRNSQRNRKRDRNSESSSDSDNLHDSNSINNLTKKQNTTSDYSCLKCNKRFRRKVQLDKHIKSHNVRQDSDTEEILSTSSSDSDVYDPKEESNDNPFCAGRKTSKLLKVTDTSKTKEKCLSTEDAFATRKETDAICSERINSNVQLESKSASESSPTGFFVRDTVSVTQMEQVNNVVANTQITEKNHLSSSVGSAGISVLPESTPTLLCLLQGGLTPSVQNCSVTNSLSLLSSPAICSTETVVADFNNRSIPKFDGSLTIITKVNRSTGEVIDLTDDADDHQGNSQPAESWEKNIVISSCSTGQVTESTSEEPAASQDEDLYMEVEEE